MLVLIMLNMSTTSGVFYYHLWIRLSIYIKHLHGSLFEPEYLAWITHTHIFKKTKHVIIGTTFKCMSKSKCSDKFSLMYHEKHLWSRLWFSLLLPYPKSLRNIFITLARSWEIFDKWSSTLTWIYLICTWYIVLKSMQTRMLVCSLKMYGEAFMTCQHVQGTTQCKPH